MLHGAQLDATLSHNLGGSDWQRAGGADLFADSLDGRGANLADLHPGSFRKIRGLDLMSQRESCPLRLAGESNRDYCTRSFVEDIVAEDEDRAHARVFPTKSGVKRCLADLAFRRPTGCQSNLGDLGAPTAMPLVVAAQVLSQLNCEAGAFRNT